MTVVLLTGFPALRAKRLCESLLVDEATVVRALVRPKFMQNARDLVDAMPIASRSRITLIEGECGAIDLGLSGAELARLADEVTLIHHAAQLTHLNVDRELAVQVNVRGAREVLEVAELCKHLRCVVMHSQTCVSGSHEGLFRECDLDVGQSYRTPVEETLARAEKLSRDAMARLPVAVVRSALVVGDSLSGYIDRFDAPYELMWLMLTSPPDFALPLGAKADAVLNLVPIDFVARASAAIGADPRAPGKTFQLVDPAALPARRVFELFASAAGRRAPRASAPSSLGNTLLRAGGIERFTNGPRNVVASLATATRYDARNADLILGPLGIRCPPFASYVGTLAAYAQSRLREGHKASEPLPARGAP